MQGIITHVHTWKHTHVCYIFVIREWVLNSGCVCLNEVQSPKKNFYLNDPQYHQNVKIIAAMLILLLRRHEAHRCKMLEIHRADVILHAMFAGLSTCENLFC